MKKKITVKKRHLVTKSRKPKKFHHRLISFFKGDGGIYVIFILATVMAGAFALTGGILPQLSQNPTAADQVEIDEDSAKQSSTSALQLVDIKIKPTATPTPSPLPTVATPTVPQTTLACLDRTVITLMIDLSASMLNDGKAAALNNALGDFTDVLYQSGGRTLVGALGFGAGVAFSTDNTPGVTQIMGYTSNKDLIKERLTTLSPGAAGGTYTRNAFSNALSRITAYQTAHAADSYRYVTILFTDGIPEYGEYGNCYKETSDSVCWSKQQDPRSAPFSMSGNTDLTQAMKGKSEKVYSIGIFSSAAGARGNTLTPDLTTLLKTVATKTTAPYYQGIDLKSGKAQDLTALFDTIVDTVCSAI